MDKLCIEVSYTVGSVGEFSLGQNRLATVAAVCKQLLVR